MRNPSVHTLLLAAIVTSSVAGASIPFPYHVRAAIVRTLQSEDVAVEGASDPQFVLYDARGKLEAFQCPSLAAFTLLRLNSGSGSTDWRITIGECPKDARLNETTAEVQATGFSAAISAAVGGSKLESELRKTRNNWTMPQVVEADGTVFIHFAQWAFFARDGTEHKGIGFIPLDGPEHNAAGMFETVLMIPAGSDMVVLVQGQPIRDCSPRMRLPFCDDFGDAMREVAKQVRAALSSPIPPPAFHLEPLRPGRPHICDSLGLLVAEALEESDVKQIPIVDTIRYKQATLKLPDFDVQAMIRGAAREHAQGMDISNAAMKVGKECARNSFEKK